MAQRTPPWSAPCHYAQPLGPPSSLSLQLPKCSAASPPSVIRERDRDRETETHSDGETAEDRETERQRDGKRERDSESEEGGEGETDRK